jgi:hypothetical protein
MAEPFIVLVLILSSGGGGDPTWSTVTGSAQKAIGEDAVVLAQAPGEAPSDADALALGEKVHANAVVEVSWADPEQVRALLHIHLSRTPAWIDREIRFDPDDSPAERGRTLGFAFGSMISSARTLEPVTPAAEPANTVPAPAAAELPTERAPPSPSPRRSAFAVDVDAIASVGVGGNAEGYGGSVDLRWYALPFVAPRLGAGIRAGPVPPAQASCLTVEGAAGTAFRLLATRNAHPLELGLRTDLLLIRHELTRTSGSTTTRLNRWLSGADFAVEGAWSFAPGISVVVAPGVQAAFGDTQVFAGTKRLATIPIWRAVGELGVRVVF